MQHSAQRFLLQMVCTLKAKIVLLIFTCRKKRPLCGSKIIKMKKKIELTQTLSFCCPSHSLSCKTIRAVRTCILPPLVVVGPYRAFLTLIGLRVSILPRRCAVSWEINDKRLEIFIDAFGLKKEKYINNVSYQLDF